MTTSTAADR